MLGSLHRCGRGLHFLAHVGRTEKMHALSSVARETFALRWRPSGDTAVALLTAVVMVGLYYANARAAQGSVFSLVVFVILTNGVLNVLFPAYYMLVLRREGLNQLGITRRWWWLALLLSAVVSVLSWPQLQQIVAQQPDTDLLPLLLANGLILWEPFFVYGWLQLRLERAFGIIPGIALAAVCFGAYHIGTFPLSGVGSLVLLGVFFGVLFRVAGGNLLATTMPSSCVEHSSLFNWLTYFYYPKDVHQTRGAVARVVPSWPEFPRRVLLGNWASGIPSFLEIGHPVYAAPHHPTNPRRSRPRR